MYHLEKKSWILKVKRSHSKSWAFPTAGAAGERDAGILLLAATCSVWASWAVTASLLGFQALGWAGVSSKCSAPALSLEKAQQTLTTTCTPIQGSHPSCRRFLGSLRRNGLKPWSSPTHLLPGPISQMCSGAPMQSKLPVHLMAVAIHLSTVLWRAFSIQPGASPTLKSL